MKIDRQLEGVGWATLQAHNTLGPADGFEVIAHEHLEGGPSSEPMMRGAEGCPAP